MILADFFSLNYISKIQSLDMAVYMYISCHAFCANISTISKVFSVNVKGLLFNLLCPPVPNLVALASTLLIFHLLLFNCHQSPILIVVCHGSGPGPLQHPYARHARNSEIQSLHRFHLSSLWTSLINGITSLCKIEERKRFTSFPDDIGCIFW